MLAAVRAATAVLGDNRGELERGDFDVWLYEGRAGEIISLHMVADRPLTDWTIPVAERHEAGVLDTVVQIVSTALYQPDYSDDDFAADFSRLSDAHIRAVRLPADGVYRIEARSALEDQAGPYTLTIERVPEYWTEEMVEAVAGTYAWVLWGDFISHIYSLNGHLINVFPGLPGVEEWVPIGEDELTCWSGDYGRVVRDENGEVVKIELWESYDFPFGNYWYDLIRVGDMPPDYTPPENAALLFGEPR